ncbi:hypothetical protein E2C01_097333 [Portunus trituberculatus]|uniref:Uncharacterized protein n=1 Tax=Portunus trituberculatus TaxID=210409 RepID=A0A5B7K9A4_PORTR|nr:hypothetical protein [Portunus trituberculatus]
MNISIHKTHVPSSQGEENTGKSLTRNRQASGGRDPEQMQGKYAADPACPDRVYIKASAGRIDTTCVRLRCGGSSILPLPPHTLRSKSCFIRLSCFHLCFVCTASISCRTTSHIII